MMQVIGCLMKNTNILSQADKYDINFADFDDLLNRYIYQAIQNFYAAGARTISVVDLDNFFQSRQEIKVEYDIDSAANLRLKILKKLRLPKDCNLTYKIVKKSIDARKKPEVYYVYEVLCNLDKNLEENLLKVNNKDIVMGKEVKYEFRPQGIIPLKNPIIVVGSGPAGLFASLNLVRNGYPVIIIERGCEIEKRVIN